MSIFNINTLNNYSITHNNISNPFLLQPVTVNTYGNEQFPYIKFVKCNSNDNICALYIKPNKTHSCFRLFRVKDNLIDFEFVSQEYARSIATSPSSLYASASLGIPIQYYSLYKDCMLEKDNKIYCIDSSVGLFVLDISDYNNIREVPISLNSMIQEKLKKAMLIDFYDNKNYLLVCIPNEGGYTLVPITDIF